jgi:hypothetical protein
MTTAELYIIRIRRMSQPESPYKFGQSDCAGTAVASRSRYARSHGHSEAWTARRGGRSGFASRSAVAEQHRDAAEKYVLPRPSVGLAQTADKPRSVRAR